MATQNITLNKSDGWMKISEENKVYALTPQLASIEAVWAIEPPSNYFVGYPISPGLGIARDFEEGHLYLKLPMSAHIDEVLIVFDEG